MRSRPRSSRPYLGRTLSVLKGDCYMTFKEMLIDFIIVFVLIVFVGPLFR